MTHEACIAPLPLEELIAYQAGELDEATVSRLEEHFFGCAFCTRRIEEVVKLGAAIAEVMRRGLVSSSVTADLLERGVQRGLAVRSYALAAGEVVACTIAPHDDFVAIRLAIKVADDEDVDLDVNWTALASGETQDRSLRAVALDRKAQEIVLLFSGDMVRSVPRSRWTMQAVAHSAGGVRRVGPYTLEHTPWDQLAHA
jgi:hypothetical protein